MIINISVCWGYAFNIIFAKYMDEFEVKINNEEIGRRILYYRCFILYLPSILSFIFGICFFIVDYKHYDFCFNLFYTSTIIIIFLTRNFFTYLFYC